MGSAFTFLFICNLILFSSSPAIALDIDIGIGIGIGIGGGGGKYPPPSNSPDCNTSPPPPPPSPSKPSPVSSPSPPPPPPPKIKLPPKPPSPPPPKPPSKPPLQFKSKGIEIAFRAIQAYRSRIKHDPLGILNTWTGTNVCKYKGFKCNNLPDKDRTLSVSGLSFNNFNFSGPKFTLDGLVDRLPDIAFFHANSNFFFGAVPAGITVANVRFFYELDLSNNNFIGYFPGEVLAATNLTFLDLRFNNYFGPVRPELFDMDIISAIFLNNNKFSGSIPANLGNTPARYLTFTKNEFTGPIPKTIGTGKAKTTLLEVLFSNNKLSGCIPMEIGLLQNTILFDASANSLTGPIPLSFSCLPKMEILNFANNQLSGTVPEGLCTLHTLHNLTLSHNFFTHVGPACRALISRKVLDVSRNCILGLPNQRSEEECKWFFSDPARYSCSDAAAMKLVPCKGYKYPPVGPRPPPRKMMEMRTYAALVPN